MDAARAALRRHLTEGWWRIGGGEGSLNAIFLPGIAKVREHAHLGPIGATSALRVHFYMDRPAGERARLCIEVIGNLPGLTARANKELRDTLASSLREALPDCLLEHPGRGATLSWVGIPAPGIVGLEDDTDERVQQLQDRIDEGVRLAKELEQPLSQWVETKLCSLLPAP